VPRHPPSFPCLTWPSPSYPARPRSSSSAQLRRAPPEGEVGKGKAEPDEASVLWLRLAQTTPISGISRAPPPKSSDAEAFGRVPTGAGGGAGAGAL
jgi:hypothetical protein